MFVVYLILLIVILYFIKKRDMNYHNSFSPSIILLITHLIYTLFGSLYISEITDNNFFYYTFWFIQISSLFGILIAVLFNKFRRKTNFIKTIPSRFTIILFIIISLSHLIVYVNKYGGVNEIFNSGYKLVYESGETNYMQYSVLGMLAAFSIKYNFSRLISFVSFIFFAVAMLLGTRGIALGFICIPFMAYYLNENRFSYNKFLLAIPLVIFFLLIAYVRNIGFSNILSLLYLDYDFFFSLFVKNSEFNTTGSVIFTGLSNPNWYNHNILEYISGIISSIVPKGLWPDRPDAISNLFSDKFAPTGEGIGFSVAYEAFLLLGWFGPLIYFYFIQRFLQKLYGSKKSILNAIIVLSPLLIFWINRIDFQTIFKITLVYLFFYIIWSFVIRFSNSFLSNKNSI